MVDNEKYDDEYEFIDPDTGVGGATDTTMNAAVEPSIMDKTFSGKSGVIRNVLIVVGLVIIVMVIYPFIHSSLQTKKKTPVFTEAMTPITTKSITPTPVNTPDVDMMATKALDEQVTQKLSALEASQQQMQTEVASTNSQLSNINTNINDMVAKVTELNRVIALYAAKVDEQARDIEHLTAQAAKKKSAVHHAKARIKQPSIGYAIQAVIPGRAWLVATNGTTLTVREGTMIAGLGMVKLIDARQGRVVTSLGRVIRFSQEDS